MGGDAEVTEEEGETMSGASRGSGSSDYVQDGESADDRGVAAVDGDEQTTDLRLERRVESRLDHTRRRARLIHRIPTRLSTRNLPAPNIWHANFHFYLIGHRTRDAPKRAIMTSE